MSIPTRTRNMRLLKAMSPDWLTERITLRHYEQTEDAEYGGTENTLAWETEVWASMHPYDEWVGRMRERDQYEGTAIEVFFGVCYSQDNVDMNGVDTPVNPGNMVPGDQIEWNGRTFYVSVLDKAQWPDAVALYCRTEA